MALRLKQSLETEIYVTEDGYAAIRQQESEEPWRDMTVILTADQLPHVIRELQALLDDRASWEFSDVDETDNHNAMPPRATPEAP